MDVRDLVPRGQRHQMTVPVGFYAQFATHPSSLSETVYVIIPDIDMDTRWGPCFWQSRDDLSLPEIGDKCLVIFDNRRTPWVVTWWPFTLL